MKYDIFISYRREGGYETAKHLNDLLVRDGYRVSFDIDTLRSGDFDTQLFTRIEQCKDFILIVDEHAFDRTLDIETNPNEDWLRCELAHALKHNKNIIPVFLSGVSEFPDGLPEDVVDVVKKNGPEYNKYYFDDFYETLRKRFIKSISKKTKLFILFAILIMVLSVFFVTELFKEDIVVYEDPSMPHKPTDEAQFEEFVKNEISLIKDFISKDSLFILNECLENAKQGGKDAQYKLGLFYYDGYLVENSYKESFKYFKMAAKQGHAKAQYSVGCFFNNGIYVKEDYDEAGKWNHISAEQGFAPAQNDYGIFCTGNTNYKPYEAYNWFTKAAEQDYALAQYNLAKCYVYSIGVQSDIDEAIYWMERSSNNDYNVATYQLASVYVNVEEYRDIIEAVELLKSLADEDFAPALYDLGLCYLNNIGYVGIDYDKAYELIKKSAEQNYAPAIVNLGMFYINSFPVLGIEQNYKKAMDLFLKAVDMGYAMAYYCVGEVYRMGYGVKPSMRKAQKWYNEAEKRGFNMQQYQSQQQLNQMKNS